MKINISTQSRALLPKRATEHSAGYDLSAKLTEAKILTPGQRSLIPTGISIALPVGYEAQIRPRSGLALKHGITVLNSPGTIDADYRGEIQIILINLGQEHFEVTPGMRIAQMVIQPVVPTVEWIISEVLEDTLRNTGGFGSTGF